MIKTISSLHWLSRPLIFALALMLIIGAGFPTPTRAQSDAETVWYWATTPEGLVAYTLDGEINLVLPSNELAGVSFSARPLTETLTLLTSKTISYLMTPDEVINTFTAQQYPYLYYGGTGETYSRPYLIIWSEEPTRWVRILNTETGESQELNGGALGLRLLSDGHTIRHVVNEYSPDHVITSTTLREYDFITKTESVLYTFDLTQGFPYVMSSEDGLVWLIGYGHDWAKNTFTQLDSIGNVSPILMDWLSNGEAVIQDNFIIAFDKYCGSYCSIRLYPLNGYDARRVVLPPQVSPPFYFFDAFSDDSFLIQDYVGETLWAWLRTADNRWLSLGIIGTQDWNTIRVQSIHDDQWALALVDEYYYYKLRLWNLRRAEIAFEIRVEKSLDHYDVWSSGDSVLIRRNNEAWKFYSAAENKLINVENFQDSKFQILPNGQLLYQAPEGGIYLVDAKTELTTLLVPNGYMASRHWLYQ